MDQPTAPVGGADAIVSVPVVTPATPDRTEISASEAARQLSAFRWKRDNPEAAKAEEAKAPEPAPETAAAEQTNSAVEADAAPPQEVPGETTATPEPAQEPPIEPPRSWTKEAKERWQSLPRDTQEYLATREQERDRDLRRSQNEAAEKLKGLTAKEQQAEQVRQQYEKALPALLQTLQEQQQGEFSDIKTMADVEKLAREDWPRYALWDAQQKKIAAVSSEVKAAQDRQVNEFRGKWTEYASKEDGLAAEKIPELADKSKAAKFSDGAIALLKDIGFNESELSRAWNGEASLSLRDHRVQVLLADAFRYREAKTAIAKPAPKPVPPVQRPGVSKAPTSAADAEIQALEKRFEKTGNPKDGAALLNARRRIA